jgi:hypothetical protein
MVLGVGYVTKELHYATLYLMEVFAGGHDSSST